MNTYCAVTTFSKKGWEEYGRVFLQTYLEFWPQSVPLYIGWEGDDWPKEYPVDRVTWFNLDESSERRRFLDGDKGDDVKDYRLCAKRFSHKVFALGMANEIVPKESSITWLDADIETEKPVTREFLDSVAPAGFAGAYLGRKDWNHSECGFVVYHDRDIIKEFVRIYDSGEIFSFNEWHDSYIFDQIKDGFGWWYNISEGVPGMHVWDDCPLGEVMNHKKGPMRKAGKKVTDPGYASLKEMDKSVGNIGDEKLLIKTKNCVDDKQIQANINYAVTMADNYLPQCSMDMDAVCIMVSAGPSLKGQIEHIREMAAKPNHYVVAVKHALNTLIEAGIKPWACILLDPRNHVGDFIPEDEDGIKYFVASMCHPSTFDKLKEKEYWVYHACVGAGEDETLRARVGKSHFMVSGGCSTAMRGLSVMHLLGFRRFRLFAYDCCFFEPQDEGAVDKYGNQLYFEMDIGGKKFWTDAEKVAQAQDFQGIIEQMTELDFEVYGPGMIPHIFNQKRALLPNFKDGLIGRQTTGDMATGTK